MIFVHLILNLKCKIMRKILFVLFLIPALFIISCDKFTVIPVPFDIPTEIAFDINSAAVNSFNKEFVVKLSEVPELETYLNKIDALTIKQIVLSIPGYSDSSSHNCILNGTLKYSSSSSSVPIDLTTFDNVNIYNLFVDQTEYKCPSNADEYQKAADQLKNKGEIKFYLNASVDDIPAKGVAKLIISAEAKVNILK